MKFYKFKIQEKYIEPIRKGIKRHEYRLATPERKQAQIGDVLILVNKSNIKESIKVVVKSIEFYSSWDEPLEKYWKQDFNGVFDSLESIKKACHGYYAKEEVDKYGIEVFEIEPYVLEFKESNILLDTNIVIHSESSNSIVPEVVQVYRTIDELKSKKFVLGDIKKEIQKHKDQNVVNNMMLKLEKYNFLETKAIDDEYFKSVVSNYGNDENSQIDNNYLYQVYKGLVDFLITDDKGILKKAKDLYIDDLVFSTEDFLNAVEEKYPTLIAYDALSVKLSKISDLDVTDSFFDTLREDYEGIKFNNWFNKKSKSGENAYIFKNNNGLQGFLYLKIESTNEKYDDITPRFEPKRRLKVGTFKVNSTGLRVGERFLKIIFDYAFKSKVDEIYVTLFENKRNEVKTLMNLMIDWGFERFGYKNNGELVLVKKMKSYNMNKDPKFNYPNIKPNFKCSILPINADYHTVLFPDLKLKNESMKLFLEKPCGYAVEKIYVCNSKNIQLQPGDLLAIYYMADGFYKKYKSVISGLCVLEDIIYSESYDKYLGVCKNRTVFDNEQLKEFYYSNTYRTILKVLFLKPLNKKIILEDLYENDIINREQGPRLKTIVSDKGFKKLLELGGVDKI